MKRFLGFLVLGLVLILAIASCNLTSSGGGGGDIVVASKDFTEQDILGELLAQQIEATTKLKVERKPRLGGLFVCHNAIVAGKVDAYIDYTGTVYTSILKQKSISSAREVFDKLKAAYAQQFKLEVMPPLGYESTFAMTIRGEDAKKYNLTNLSDAAKYTPQWRGGFGYEFVERPDGLAGLVKTYNLRFREPPKLMSLDLIYRALTQGLVDIVAGSSTDGQIARLGLVVLKDSLGYFPPYEAVPIVRQETLQKYPELKAAISQLIGKITAEEIQKLNSLVEGELRDVKEVVREFRKSQGL
ncbi:ABC transporter substrate-binding protein [Scytonema hofmannii PCC 7110]|uniref:ABC transporter substrate-binding protein n=1 Tax=Scytonema hofmannii PCC 7110 TaxID=128403 RepID=A0A139WTD4_9CYAN|nr:glycine betaine ABC transporter substrate-binding protein [Scytonema hofmannii]KYC35692.1 ABC transporter substrate-binding protein [Scytonema hofmannii PCC 7110]